MKHKQNLLPFKATNNFWLFKEVVILVLGPSHGLREDRGGGVGGTELRGLFPSVFLLPSYTLDYLGHRVSVTMTLGVRSLEQDGNLFLSHVQV